MANDKPAVNRMRNISSIEQGLIEGEKAGAQRSRQFNDAVAALKWSPTIGGQLLTLPGISDILLKGSRLGAKGQILPGGSIPFEDLPLDIRSALNIGPGQDIALPPDVLAIMNSQNPAIAPFKSLQDIIKAPGQQPISESLTAPSETILEQSDIASGGLQELVNRLTNIIAPTVRTSLPPQLAGLEPLLNMLAGRPTQIGGTAEQPITGEAPSGLEGLQRILSDLSKSVKQAVPSKTREQASLEALSTKFPELSGRTDKKGLEKFAGAGEFKVNGNRYKIDNSGRIVRIGAK